MDLKTLTYRIRLGEEYLFALAEFHHREWCTIFEDYERGRLTIAQSLVLVHPRYYIDRETEVGKSIRGIRKFDNVTGRDVSRCMAEQVWLSTCTLQNSEELHSDHWFPFSLGGPTLADNQLYLCPIHNYSKGSDVHLFPWERGKPVWFERQVERIQRLIT